MKQLILRTCEHDLISTNDFQWKMGMNIAPDWKSTKECGNGLHGLLWGEGVGNLLYYSLYSKWLVGEIEEYVDLNGCVKFPSCNIIFIGNQEQATQFLYKNSKDKAICGLIMNGKNLKGGDRCRLTGEDRAKIEAGNYSNVVSGNNCNITAKYDCNITAGYLTYITAGNHSRVEARSDCNVTVGNDSRIKVTDNAIVTAGNHSRITAGNWARVEVGSDCNVTVGDFSKIKVADNAIVMTGNNSIIVYCGKTNSVVSGIYLVRDGLIVPKQL